MPDNLTPTPRAVRRRQRTWLLVALRDPAAAPASWRSVTDVTGFAHGELVPEMSFGRTSPAIDELEAALARVAPDLYVGVIREGRRAGSTPAS